MARKTNKEQEKDNGRRAVLDKALLNMLRDLRKLLKFSKIG